MGTKYTYSEGTTYQSESTPITISNIPTGEYKIKAVKGDYIGKATYIASPGTQVLTITISKPVYSIIYDKSLASDSAGCLTYAGLCKGFTPMSGGSGNANEGSWAEGNGTLFDSIKVGYLNGSTFVEQSKSAVPGSTSYNCFTRIPKIYQRVTQLDSNRVKLDLSLTPFSGGTLHPAFIMDRVELNYKDIGRYLAYNNSSKLESKSGKSPTVSTTRADFRTYAKANGSSNYGLLSYYDWDLVNKLYLFAFKNWNSQGVIGAGHTFDEKMETASNTGGSNGKSWMYGTSSTYTQVSMLGIENWWGDLYQWIDNYMNDSSYIYASNTASPSDSVSDMTAICANPTYSIVKGCPLTCRAGLNDFFIGENSSGSYNSSGMCDYQYFSAGSSIAYVGGSWSGGSNAGAFYFRSNSSIMYSDSNIGARLVHWE